KRLFAGDPRFQACLGSRSDPDPRPGSEQQARPPRSAVAEGASFEDGYRRPFPCTPAGLPPHPSRKDTIPLSQSDNRPRKKNDAVRKKASGSSFYLAMRLMPRAEREAMFAIYAFCRKVDDIADDGIGTRAERHARLDQWRADLDALYRGEAAGQADFL